MFALNGRELSSARVSIPRLGRWLATVETVDDLALAVGAPARLGLGDLVLEGHVVGGGLWAGTGTYSIVAGAGGWSRDVPARAYRSDDGIHLAAVARDLAAEAGERMTIEAGADRVLGYAWSRLGGLAISSLADMAAPWWIDSAGLTHVGARPTFHVASALQYTVERFDPSRRRAVLSTADETLSALCTPGATWSDPRIAGPFVTSSACLDVTAGAVRIEVIG